jgi:hypothetical protein
MSKIRFIRRFALPIAAITLAFLAAEIALRLAGVDCPARDTGIVPHSLWHHWHRPNHAFSYTVPSEAITQAIRFNEHGMRDSRTISLAKPHGVRRIALVGDSFVEALQVAELEGVCSRLEHRLQEHLGAPVEVLNFGCSGFSSITEYCLLNNCVGQFAPDMVVCLHHFSDTTEDWLLPPQPWNEDGPSIWKPVLMRSQLYRVAAGVADRCRRHRASPADASLQTSFDAVLHDPYTTEDLQAWDRSLGYVGKMATWCYERKIPFLLVIIPIGTQIEPVSPEFAAQMGFQYLANGKRLENANYQRRVSNFCRTLGIDCLDLLDAFRAENPAGRPCFYLPRDQHWTAAGHDLAARQIMSYIVQQWPANHNGEPWAKLTP